MGQARTGLHATDSSPSADDLPTGPLRRPALPTITEPGYDTPPSTTATSPDAAGHDPTWRHNSDKIHSRPQADPDSHAATTKISRPPDGCWSSLNQFKTTSSASLSKAANQLPSLPPRPLQVPFVTFHSFHLEPAHSAHRSPIYGTSMIHHTYTASLPGPRGPGSHDPYLARPARPSLLCHVPLWTLTRFRGPLPPSAPPRHRGDSRPPWTWATATGTGHLPPPPACPKQPGSPHQPQASRLGPTLSRTRHLGHWAPRPRLPAQRPDPRCQ